MLATVLVVLSSGYFVKNWVQSFSRRMMNPVFWST